MWGKAKNCRESYTSSNSGSSPVFTRGSVEPGMSFILACSLCHLGILLISSGKKAYQERALKTCLSGFHMRNSCISFRKLVLFSFVLFCFYPVDTVDCVTYHVFFGKEVARK